MLKGTRATGTPDVQRIAAAVRGPGIDTRTWVSYAIVTAIVVDPAHGVIADVTLMPSGQEGSARVGSEYAGGGFGFHFPLRVDDEVLVELADGDPDHGYVITRRFWSPSDVPPQAVVDNPDDAVLVVNTDKSLRLVVQGAGNIVLQCDQGKILAGDDGADDPLIRRSDLKSFIEDDYAVHVHTSTTAGNPTSTPTTTATVPDGSSVISST